MNIYCMLFELFSIRQISHGTFFFFCLHLHISTRFKKQWFESSCHEWHLNYFILGSHMPRGKKVTTYEHPVEAISFPMGVPFPPEQMIHEEGSYLLDKQLPWNPKKQSYILSLGSIPSHSKSYAQVHGEFNYCQVNHGQPRIPVSKKDLWRAHAILKWADESR